MCVFVIGGGGGQVKHNGTPYGRSLLQQLSLTLVVLHLEEGGGGSGNDRRLLFAGRTLRRPRRMRPPFQCSNAKNDELLGSTMCHFWPACFHIVARRLRSHMSVPALQCRLARAPPICSKNILKMIKPTDD